jgi:hypothetical protein
VWSASERHDLQLVVECSLRDVGEPRGGGLQNGHAAGCFRRHAVWDPALPGPSARRAPRRHHVARGPARSVHDVPCGAAGRRRVGGDNRPPQAAMTDQYGAGACNIGPEEVAMRRQTGHVGVGVTAVLAAALVRSDLRRAWRPGTSRPGSASAPTLGFRGVDKPRRPRARAAGHRRPGPGRRPSPGPADHGGLGGRRARCRAGDDVPVALPARRFRHLWRRHAHD